MTKLELYDCTLRDGEQAAGASFNLEGRINLFKELDEFGIDFIEVGWPLAGKKVMDSFHLCKKIQKNSKIVAFGSTCIKPDLSQDANLKSILLSGSEYACIFGKSHLQHVEKQLRVTPQENLDGIKRSVEFLRKNGLHVFYDAEHFFDAFKEHPEYALASLESAIKGGAERVILCDTKGSMLPEELKEIVKKNYDYLKSYSVPLGVHLHNDRGLALANAIVSLDYVQQVQGTINGMGERVGNLDLSQFIPVYQNILGKELDIKKSQLKSVHDLAYILSGLDIPSEKPFVGQNAFAHKGGVHIDGISKGAGYEHINPEEYGNKRILVLNTLGGSATVVEAAKQFGYRLNKKNPIVQKKIHNLFEELSLLEEKGYRMGAIPAEQYLLVKKHFGCLRKFFSIQSSRVETEMINSEETSRFFLAGMIVNKPITQVMTVKGGPVDAAYKTLINVLSENYPRVKDLKILNFKIGIANPHSEESTVRTIITFDGLERFETVGVDKNMFYSSLEALTKGISYHLNRTYGPNSKLNKSKTNQ